MAEYHIEIAEKLVQAAGMVIDDGVEKIDAQRTVLYLCLLATEISLKAMLEKAGRPVEDIRKRSHDLSELLLDLGKCEIEVEISLGVRHWASASRLRSYGLTHGLDTSTVGAVIDAEGPSKYPNQIRYGDDLRHFPPEVVAQMASKVTQFARQHWGTIRIRRC